MFVSDNFDGYFDGRLSSNNTVMVDGLGKQMDGLQPTLPQHGRLMSYFHPLMTTVARKSAPIVSSDR